MLKRFGQPTPPSAPTTRPVPSDAPKHETPRVEASPQETPATPSPAAETPESRETGNKLIVGPNIKLKGSEITDCDILIVEGRVEASMHSRDIRIAEGGTFVGVAEIDTAEVRGAFEGELIARKRLVIHTTGKVSGKIRYGALTVEEGGTLSGDVGSLGAASALKVTDVPASAPKVEKVETETTTSAQAEPLRPTQTAFARSPMQRR